VQKEHLQFLACPDCHAPLEIATVESESGGRIENGLLRCMDCQKTYPIIRFIPRFVSEDNYATTFGYQWTIHARTQYDSYNGTTISEMRFFNETKWPRRLAGETILEVGSGSGRFTEQAISTGAMVVSLDYSYAVEANYASNGHHSNVLIVQGSIYDMPFPENFFDKVICIGVLQHTPDVKRSFMELPSYLKSGGRLVVDVYIRETGFLGSIKHLIKMKYWVRPFTRRVPPEKLYRWVEHYVRTLWPLTSLISLIPRFGRKFNFAVLLVADYRGAYPLSEAQLKEWAILDTFDMLSPAYDTPQSVETLRNWFVDAGMSQIEVHRGYNGVEGRGIKG
jgi:SAM-dependent methyltransferase